MSARRRDPRAEREAHRVAGGARPRYTLEAATVSTPSADGPAGRPRRDPRAETAALVVAGTARRRVDRTLFVGGPAGSAVVAAATGPRGAEAAAPSATPPVKVIAAPAYLVLVVPDLVGGRRSAHDRQLLGAARILADAGGGGVVVLGEEEADWAAAGADRVLRLPSRGGGASSPARYDPAGRAAVVAAAIRALGPRHVVFAETADGGDLARRVAAALGDFLFAGAESVSARGLTRPAKAGRVEQRAAPPRLISVLADVVAAHSGPPHEARPMPTETAAVVVQDGEAAGPATGVAGGDARAAGPAPATPAAVGGIVSAEFVPADPARVPLAEAEFVLSAGNGVSDFDTFRDLAAALGATPGASRVVCDAGLMPRDRQVGASGTVLDATCYFALGIAGAPQHLQGVAKCEHVVAVNTDLHAAMIERAGLAVVADAQAVMPALLAALAAEAASGGAASPLAALASAGGSGVRRDALPSVAADTGAGRGRPSASPPVVGEAPRAVVLLSAGRHPVSGRPSVVRAEAQATALALGLGGAVRGLHAGPDPTAVADHLGHGLGEIDHLPLAADADPVPALVAALAAEPADLVLAGRRGQGGDDTGLVPYRLAAALGFAFVADAAAVSPGPVAGTLVVEQALGRGARRRLVVRLPVVVSVHAAAPAPRPYAFGPARRGHVVVAAGRAQESAAPVAPAVPLAPSVDERPWRRRPRLIAGAVTAGTAEERLKAATEVAGGGGRLMVGPAPAEAAAEILAFLRGTGVLAR